MTAGGGLVFLPYIYTGWGSSYTPVAIAHAFGAVGYDAITYLPSLRALPPPGLTYRTWLPPALPRPLRGGRFHGAAYRYMVRQLIEEVRRREPPCTIWLWPAADLDTICALKDAGAFLVREMINTTQVTVRKILEAEAARSGLQGPMFVTDDTIRAETAELELVDRVVSPSASVDQSLLELGLPADKIFRSHFGWDPGRFRDFEAEKPGDRPFTALFVGDITVRKGAHLALDAWRSAAIHGQFRMVGRVSPEMELRLEAATRDGTVRHVPFTHDLSPHYRAADVLLFPTLEEGAPLVCYEAAAFAVPIVTGPMGAARMLEDGVSGLIVDPHDHEALVDALRLLAQNPTHRRRLGQGARAAAGRRTWTDAARNRVELLMNDTVRSA